MKKWATLLIGSFAFTVMGAGVLGNLVSLAVSSTHPTQGTAASFTDRERMPRTLFMAAEEDNDEGTVDEGDSTAEDDGAEGKDRIGDAPKLG